MKKIWTATALLWIAAGCHKSSSAQKTTGPGSAASTGSASASGSGSASAAPAPAPLTAQELSQRFAACWTAWNAAKWDDVKACYADGAVADSPGTDEPTITGSAAIVDRMKAMRAAFPDEKGTTALLLVDAKQIVAVTLLDGKQSGPLPTAHGALAPTNRSMGMYLAQVLTLDEKGKVTHEWDYLDRATLLGQLQPKKDQPVRAVVDKLPGAETITLAQNDAKESGNLATLQQLDAAFDQHDAKGFGAMLGDDTVWSDQTLPKDLDKKEALAHLESMWKSFSDGKLTVNDSWSAGDYVAAVETFDGTKGGKKVTVPMLVIHQIVGNKVKSSWLFYQSESFARQLGEPASPAAGAKKSKH